MTLQLWTRERLPVKVEHPSNSNKIGYWADKSGTGHHAKVYQNNDSYKPKYYSASMNSKPTVQFDGSNDYLLLENGRSDFHQWDKLTVLLVYEDWGSEVGEE